MASLYGIWVSASSSNVNEPLTGFEPPQCAISCSALPNGLTRRMSISLAKLWFSPLSVTVTFFNVFGTQATYIVDGNGDAGWLSTMRIFAALPIFTSPLVGLLSKTLILAVFVRLPHAA